MFCVIQARAWVIKEIKRVENLEESLFAVLSCNSYSMSWPRWFCCILHVQACNHDEGLFEIDVCYVRRPWVDGTHTVSRPYTYTPRRRTVLWSFLTYVRSRTSLSLSLSLSFSLAHVTSWWTYNEIKSEDPHTHKNTLSGEDIVNSTVMGLFFLAPILDSKKLENEQVFKFCLAP